MIRKINLFTKLKKNLPSKRSYVLYLTQNFRLDNGNDKIGKKNRETSIYNFKK